MIVKPCPECGREDAGCGCYPYFETQCRNCGAVILGREPADRCHQCADSIPLQQVEDGPLITIAPQLADRFELDRSQQILALIDETTGYTVPELADKTGLAENEIQSELSKLMDRGLITSTPDWKYRRSRRE